MYLESYITSFSEALRTARKAKNYSQIKLAEQLNSVLGKSADLESTRVRISKWERGEGISTIQICELAALCDILDVEMDYLMGVIKAPKKDMAVVVENTGWSEKAASNALYLKGLGLSPILSAFIENDDIVPLVANLRELQSLTAAYKKKYRKPLKAPSLSVIFSKTADGFEQEKRRVSEQAEAQRDIDAHKHSIQSTLTAITNEIIGEVKQHGKQKGKR